MRLRSLLSKGHSALELPGSRWLASLGKGIGGPSRTGLSAAATDPIERIINPPPPRGYVPVDQGKMRDRSVEVTPLDGRERGEAGVVTLSGKVWDVPVRVDIAHRVVRWQLAKRRMGTAKTKSRGDMRGTKNKPWRQKGTGRARAGDMKAPHHTKGSKAHGAKPRSFEHDLPKKVRRLGLKVALSGRLAESRLRVVPAVPNVGAKTKWFKRLEAALLGDTAADNTMLIIVGNEEPRKELVQATSNLRNVEVLPAQGANVYSILRRQTLVASIDGIRDLEGRLLRPIKR